MFSSRPPASHHTFVRKANGRIHTHSTTTLFCQDGDFGRIVEDIVYKDPSVVLTQALAAAFVGSFSAFSSISPPLVRRIIIIIKDKKAKSA